ncbi:MAG: CotH kinase family protein [Chloroflexota bacterium]|nr:CotH kinase family protein [Chloroflexota bacterium]
MKKLSIFIFSFLILFVLTFIIYLFDHPSPPVLSTPSGFFTKPITVSILSRGQNETIHYTLDGSIPTIDSPIYGEPILIKDRSDEPNDISMIATISYRYRKPIGNVNKITILRARSFNNITKAESDVVTRAYLIGQDIFNRYTLPIISLVVDPKDFFDQEIGIYVTGEEHEVAATSEDYYYFWPANYHRRGKDWERPIYFEYFDIEGIIKFSQKAGVRIHGDASRSFRQKSFRLYAGTEYEIIEAFKYPLFPNLFDFSGEKRIDTFRSLILRNSGTDFGAAFMRDTLIQRLVEHTSIGTQATSPVIVFLNGEYWGLYYLSEHYGEGYFLSHYEIDPNNLIILQRDGDLFFGVPKDQDIYHELIEYINSHDVKNNNVYSEIINQIDLENFIDYQITQIYIGHTDWPSKNVKFWRSRTSNHDPEAQAPNDGRWRWLLFDTDHGFSDFTVNGIEHATSEKYPTTLLRGLISNHEFKTLFLNRFADHLNTTFQKDRVIQEIDNIVSKLEPEMQEQIDRWHSSGKSMDNWYNNVEYLRIFARKRPQIMIQDLIDFFELDGTFNLNANVKNGYLKINSIEILSTTPGIHNPRSYKGVYFQNIPINVTAIPEEDFRFSHWEGSVHNNEKSPTIEILSNTDVYLNPVFIPIE